MKTQDGKCFVQSAEQIVAVMEYIDGDPLTPAPETWHSLGKVARALNEFADYPLEYGVPTNLAIDELTEHARSHFKREKFEAFIDELKPILSYPRRGLIHGEINLANAARRQDGTVTLLDWDEAGTGYTILEAGYPLITVFLTEDLHFHCDLASAFFRGYYGGNGPTQDEKQFLFQAALLHALRYMGHGDRAKRWERICYAAAHKDEIFSAIF
jgi:Ser/Thr protein kinase RdoA (MazF antagonist)